MIKKYKKKPVEIEAMKWDGKNWAGITDFCKDADINNGNLIIKTLEGVMIARVGDYIIKGIEGEFYPCEPNIFKKTYGEVKSNEVHTFINESGLIEKFTLDEE